MKNPATDQPTSDATATPYIAVAANYFGTGKTAQESRKNLAKSGGSPQEPQTVFKLPDGATNAYVGENGDLHWEGVEGEARPVFKYVSGKAVAWAQGEDKPVPFKAPTDKTKPKHNPKAQEHGEVQSESEDGTPDKESTIAATELPKAKKPGKKPQRDVVAEANEAQAAAHAQPKKKPGKKPARANESDQESADIPAEVVDAVVAESVPASAPIAPAVVKPSKDGNKESVQPADFLLFIGGSFYTKEVFIKEAATMGISRRMPSHRLPKGLVCGQSRVYVATDGGRKTDGTPLAEVFGYFTPAAVDFIQGPDQRQYADIVAVLKLRQDSRIINNTSNEPERACGHRVEGGTYIVVDKADSPLKLLDKPAHYVGNHFRGMLRLNDQQTRLFNTGGTLTTLVDEHCMKCGAEMKCAPDGHARAERERKRMEKGEEPKWLLLDAKCQKELRAARVADDGSQPVEEEQESTEAAE